MGILYYILITLILITLYSLFVKTDHYAEVSYGSGSNYYSSYYQYPLHNRGIENINNVDFNNYIVCRVIAYVLQEDLSSINYCSFDFKNRDNIIKHTYIKYVSEFEDADIKALRPGTEADIPAKVLHDLVVVPNDVNSYDCSYVTYTGEKYTQTISLYQGFYHPIKVPYSQTIRESWKTSVEDQTSSVATEIYKYSETMTKDALMSTRPHPDDVCIAPVKKLDYFRPPNFVGHPPWRMGFWPSCQSQQLKQNVYKDCSQCSNSQRWREFTITHV